MNNIFDKKINRSKNNERKWSKEYLEQNFNIDYSKKYYNLSIADLDFKSPKPIVNAIKKRANKKTYSYTYIEKEAINSIYNWYEKLHNITLDKKLIKIVHGTVNAMFEIVKCFTKENENILIQTPIYQPFERSIKKTNRNVIYNKLIYKDNNYYIDFDAFEKQIIENNVKLFLWCNPHNPGGRVWNEMEILNLIEICNRHNVLLFSDEVHGDLTLNAKHNTILNYQNNIKNFIIGNSPNKVFNLGGLKGSYIICSNKEIYEKISVQYENDSLTSPNIFFQPALIAAYNNEKCLNWLKKLKKYILNNYQLIQQELKCFDLIKILKMDASFLVWIKINKTLDWNKWKEKFYEKGLILSFYDEFANCEVGWFRINVGVRKKELKVIINKLKVIILDLKKETINESN